jgi:hypothetical protein
MADESLKLELLGRTVRVNIACDDRLIAKTLYDSLLEQCTRMALSSDGSTPLLSLTGIKLTGSLAVHPRLEGHQTGGG